MRRSVVGQGTAIHCWQALLSEVHRRTSAPSALLQSATSATLPLLGFCSRTYPLSVAVSTQRWQALFHQAYWSMSVPSAVPQLYASNALPLFRLIRRLVPSLIGSMRQR